MGCKSWAFYTSKSMNIHTAKEQFVSLYESQSDVVFRYCYLRTSHREVALDITQDAFMRCWNSMQKDTSITNHRAFLFTCARNLIIDWYRKKKSTSLDAMMDAEDEEFFVPEPNTHRADIEMGAEARYLISKIRELERPYQQPVYLRFIEDLSPKDIAAIMGESVNVISVRISRGIEKLRKIAGYEDVGRKKKTQTNE